MAAATPDRYLDDDPEPGLELGSPPWGPDRDPSDELFPAEYDLALADEPGDDH